MSVTGLCHVCESAEAVHQCGRCGALVCRRHWDRATGVCSECAAEMGTGDGPGTATDTR